MDIGPSSLQLSSAVPAETLCRQYLPHYQPIIDLTSAAIAGYEALARRRSADGRVLSAASIFTDDGVARSTRLAIDRHVREQALSDFSTATDGGFLTLNIAPDWMELLTGDRPSPTLAMIERSAIDPGRVVIEVTERSGDPDRVKRLVEAYRRAGLRIAIDDFGVGASQVDRIIALQPDFIKLDMGLFKSACRGEPEADVFLSVAAIAQRAGCKIICEGVETAEEFHFAIECGAGYVQGWLFQRAAAQLTDSHGYSAKLDALKQTYLSRKSRRCSESIRHDQRVIGRVQGLCDQLRQGRDHEHLLASLGEDYRALGVMRTYLCDRQGRQLSPNYELGFPQDPGRQGYNWSHRPYFSLLHAIQDISPGHVVVSEPYKDIVSGCMCKTFAVFVTQDRVLLVDVLVIDRVLFQGG